MEQNIPCMEADWTEKMSPEAMAVYNTLSCEDKIILDKKYPFREDKRTIIRALRKRKVKISILTEITGIPRSTISRISYIPSDYSDVVSELKSISKSLRSLEKRVIKIQKPPY